MFVDSVDSGIAPSGTLLGLLQRGRGDGTLHALAAPRAEALAALRQCVLHDPRRDWRIENRSLYYARLHMELDASLDDIEEHLFAPEDGLPPGGDCEGRTGLALSVLGHLASYDDTAAVRLLRRYAASGANWQWALDELAVRDDDAGLRELGPAVLARFPETAQGDAELAAAAQNAFEPRPWRLWAEDPSRPRQAERLRRVREAGSFDRWNRQVASQGPRPGWSVREILDWAQDGYEQHPRVSREAAAARCLSAVAGPEDREELLAAARSGREAARAAALRHLAERGEEEALSLIELAAADPSTEVAEAALCAFSRMRSTAAVVRARQWVSASEGAVPDRLRAAAAEMLACCGGVQDAGAVLSALRRTVRTSGPDSEALGPLTEGAGRLGVQGAAAVLRHIYRETSSSQLRGRAAGALALTDPSFPAGFAVECLWDCEETTRALAAEYAETGDERVVERLRRLAADPAEEAGVQSAVRGRLSLDQGR